MTREWCAEIWNPVTETWSNDAALAVPRTYHSAAVLLPDGRVFVGGGGLCGDRDFCVSGSVNHPDAQIYSPRYLFNADGTAAARPTCSIGATSVGMLPPRPLSSVFGAFICGLQCLRIMLECSGTSPGHVGSVVASSSTNEYFPHSTARLECPSNLSVLQPELGVMTGAFPGG
jgi:hypothetical protein